MTTIAEIEAAIEKLPRCLVDELAVWLETFRARRALQVSVEDWLQQARGAARPGLTTASIMELTRRES